ncbi:MAG: hypothetical protein QM473_20955 [Acidobacteriota bacterium]|nr:hypothetical protein [Acidobacteriota bacterium]
MGGSSSRVRIASGFLVGLVLALVTGPALAWNVPSGHGTRADLTREPGETYHRSPHAYISEHAIELLEKAGCDNWAAVARAHLQDLADGSRYADDWLGRGRFILQLDVLFGLASKDLYTHTYSLSAQDHYYNPDREGTGKEGLQQTSHQTISQFVDYAGAFLASGLAALPFPLISVDADCEPEVQEQFQSAAHYAQQYYDIGLMKYRNRTPAIGRGYVGNAMFYVGWASHFVQDMGVVNHTYDSHFSNHDKIEEYADGKGGDARYHAQTGIAMYPFTPGGPLPTAADFVKALARITHRPEIFESVKEGRVAEWDDIVTLGLSQSETHTAGLLALFMTEAGIDPQTPPLLGRVEALNGDVLSGVQILYRGENEEQWSVLQAGRAGYFSLPVAPSERVVLRPVLPGYHFYYYRFGTDQPGTRPFPVPYYQNAGVTEAQTLLLVLEPDPGPVVQLPDLKGLPLDRQDSVILAAPELLAAAGTSDQIPHPAGQSLAGNAKATWSLPGSKTELDANLAWRARKATLEVTSDTGILQVPSAGLGMPEAAWVRVQVNQLLALATGQEVASLPDLIQCVDTARVNIAANAARVQGISGLTVPVGATGGGIASPEAAASWQAIKPHLAASAGTGPDGKPCTLLALSGGCGCCPDNYLLTNGLVLVPSLHACEVEVRVASGYGYLGRETPALNLTTDARGATSFLLRPGNRPGKLRVLVRAKHPALAFAQPEAAVELMVYPGLVGSDAGALAPPTLSPTPQIQMMVGGFEVIEPGRKPSVSHATVTLDGAGVARLASAAARSVGLQPTVSPAIRTAVPVPDIPLVRTGERPVRSVTQDFETSPLRGWELTPNARVAEVGGSQALVLAGPGMASWTTMRQAEPKLKLRYLHARGLAEIRLCSSGNAQETQDYRLRLDGQTDPAEISLARQAAGIEKQLAQASSALQSEAWYTLEVRVDKGRIEVLIDGKSVLRANDPEPLPAGSLAFGCIGFGGFAYDDIALQAEP